jgi:ATP synthase I chain
MIKPAADRLTLSVAAFGAVISLGSLVIGGSQAGVSTAAGSVLALLNLVVLRTIVLKVIEGDIHNKLPLLALIFIKMGVFMGLVYSAIAHHWVEPIAFTIGLSSLVVGLIAGSLAVPRPSVRSES